VICNCTRDCVGRFDIRLICFFFVLLGKFCKTNDFISCFCVCKYLYVIQMIVKVYFICFGIYLGLFL